MRPSPRHVAAFGRLHASGRVMPSYVCTQCQLATQRAGLLSSRPSYNPVRFASSDNKPPKNEDKEEINLTERFRRRIWGTDNPPGQKDPYSPASPEERARMEEEERQLQEEEARQAANRRGWLSRKKEEPSIELEESAHEETAATVDQLNEALAEEVAVAAPKPRRSKPKRAKVSTVPVMIPTPEEAEEFGYVPSPTIEGLPRIGIEQDAKRELQAYMDENPFIPYIGSKKVELAAAPRIVQQALSLVLSSSDAIEPVEAGSSKAETPLVAHIMDRWTADGGIVYRLQGNVQAGERSWTEMDISSNLTFKFSLIKQVMRLSHSRIPDPAIGGFNTVGDVVSYLEIPPRPTALVGLLLQNPQLRALPNLEITPNRRNRTVIDDEFGWGKEIRKEYERRGILPGSKAPTRHPMDLEANEEAGLA